MMVAIAILALILTVISAVLLEITRAWKNTSGTTEGFRDARAAFEAMTRTISHATLNTYYDYVNSAGQTRGQVIASGSASNLANFVAATYARASDLQFVSGSGSDGKGTQLASVSSVPFPTTHSIFFVAPEGATANTNYTALNNTLTACGFYVMYGQDPSIPTFLSGNAVPVLYRYRLMQFTEPTEYLSIYDSQTQGASNSIWDKWYLGPLATTTPTSVSQLAQNIVALIILPELTPGDQAAHPTAVLAPNYDYDSRDSTNPTTYNQLPPEVGITMVAIDEASALKLGNGTTPPTNLSAGSPFTTSASLSSDLTNLENNLAGAPGNAAGNRIPLHFQVFHSEVVLESAKWSQ